MPSVPTSEPTRFTAGETLAWTKQLTDYPAGTYTLKYALQAVGAALITITATASGTDHAVTVTAATTANYAPGVYTWASYAESGSGASLERYLIERGEFTILPNPLAALGSTHASRTLALIEAALEGRIPRGLETTSIDGQSLSRMPIAELHRLRDKYRREVLAEKAASQAVAGIRPRRTIGIRFVAP